jgi:hypothetical protein
MTITDTNSTIPVKCCDISSHRRNTRKIIIQNAYTKTSFFVLLPARGIKSYVQLKHIINLQPNSVLCTKFLTKYFTVISGFRLDVDEICALLGCYAASCGVCLPTLRKNEPVLSSMVKKSKVGSICCPETSANN